MYQVITKWSQQRTVGGKTTQRELSTETHEFEWPDGVAEYVASFLRDHPRVVISGMEDFGTGSCAMDPTTLRCRAYGDCRDHHIESVSEWVEKRVDELKPDESTDLCGGGLKYFSIVITQMPEEEPEEEPEEPEEEPPAEPAEEEPPAEPAEEEPPAEPELSHTEPSGQPLNDRAPYYWHDVWEALDKAVDLLGEDIGGGERDGDLMGLVKAVALKLLVNPDATIDDVLNEDYADQGGAEAVRQWWSNWS